MPTKYIDVLALQYSEEQVAFMDHSRSQWATSLGLLADLKAGDDSGWSRFVHLYTPLIYAWCRRGGLQEADSADVCQEVFRSVSSGIDGMRYENNEASSFRGWLWTITRRTLSKHFDRAANKPGGPGGTEAMAQIAQVPDWIDDEEAPEESSAESEVMRRAAEIIKDDFEERTWQAFWMSAVEDMQASDIAEKLGMSKGGVRQAKFRVMARLKEFVGFV